MDCNCKNKKGCFFFRLTLMTPSLLFSGKKRCRCGVRKSIPLRKKPPARKPTAGGIHEGMDNVSLATSTEGRSNDQKLADIIIPAAKPNEASITFLFISFLNRTIEEPNSVINHVNKVAMKASNTGE